MATFIQSRCAFHFPSPEVGTKGVSIPAQYVGTVPDWITKTLMFQLAVSGHDITYVGQHQESPKEEKEDTGAKKRGRPAADPK